MSEPGCWVGESGAIQYAWPPEGRFAELWARVDAITTDEEKCHLHSLINKWMYENSTLIAYTNESGEWVDVEPNWELPEKWLQ